jgi:sortase A
VSLPRRGRIADPDDLSVIEPVRKPSLTLITCFPFSSIGDAPRRFIVQAKRVDKSA